MMIIITKNMFFHLQVVEEVEVLPSIIGQQALVEIEACLGRVVVRRLINNVIDPTSSFVTIYSFIAAYPRL